MAFMHERRLLSGVSIMLLFHLI